MNSKSSLIKNSVGQFATKVETKIETPMNPPKSITNTTVKSKIKHLLEGIQVDNKNDELISRGEESQGVESSYRWKGRGSEFQNPVAFTNEESQQIS